MDQLKYEILVEVFGRLEAELIESYLEAQGIDVELVQESVGHSVYPVSVDGLGRVQLFVPKDKIIEARRWLATYQTGIDKE